MQHQDSPFHFPLLASSLSIIYSAQELADMLGGTRQYYSQIFASVRPMPSSFLVELLRKEGISQAQIDYFLESIPEDTEKYGEGLVDHFLFNLCPAIRNRARAKLAAKK